MKTDRLHRVRTPPARREELLEEFDRSGLSGPKFAALTGIKYQTFAGWVQRRRQKRADGAWEAKPGPEPLPGRWLEAVVEQSQPSAAIKGAALTVQLLHGARLEITHSDQVPLAVALLRGLERPAASC
jgi:hypothetical protein